MRLISFIFALLLSASAQAAIVNCTVAGTPCLSSDRVPRSNSMIAGPLGVTISATNTLTVNNDALYGVVTPLPAGTITAIGVRPSSSNASSGASVKFCLYAVNATLSPTTLLGSTGAVAITNSTTTAFSGTLTAPITISSGNYVVAAVYTTTTTAFRFSTYSSAAPWAYYYGGSTMNAALTSTPYALGWYNLTVGQYATGCPATFPTPVAITGLITAADNQLPEMGVTYQ